MTSSTPTFCPERLLLARQRRGLFAQELATKVGVAVRSVGRWERGEATPEPDNVQALATYLDFPVDYFYGGVPTLLTSTAFRSMARMTARQRDVALAAGAQAVALDELITELFDRPSPNVPDLRGMPPEAAAESLRAQWGVGFRPIPNLVHLLERNGVRVYSLVHEGGEIDGYSSWQGSIPFIFLNTTKSAERSRMDAAHELGHLVLHANAGGQTTKVEEGEAQRFASEFLMPVAPFLSLAPRRISVTTVVEAKQYWGVSALAYVHRLRSLGRLSDWQYRSLCIEIKSTHPRSEPGPERPRETSQVLSKVLSSGAPAMNRRELARTLRIPVKDLDDMTFGLTLSVIEGGLQGRDPSLPRSSETPELKLVK